MSSTHNIWFELRVNTSTCIYQHVRVAYGKFFEYYFFVRLALSKITRVAYSVTELDTLEIAVKYINRCLIL